MYRKKSRGWYKHKDFIFLDLVCLLLSLILAYLVRNGSVRNIFELGIYHNMIFFVILALQLVACELVFVVRTDSAIRRDHQWVFFAVLSSLFNRSGNTLDLCAMLISIAYLILFICFQLVSPLSNMYL